MYPIPHNYKIHFIPDIYNKSFTSAEVISFSVPEKTSTIQFDLIDLKVNEVKYEGKEINYTFKEDLLEITFNADLIPGEEYKISIKYTGELKEGLAGWYLSKYEDKGQEKYIATSHFEAADARRTFIGVDHPNYKATFDIAFTIDKKLSAITNTLPKKEEDQGESKYIEFETSPLMSSYLLYLGVGDFEYLEDKYKDVVIRGITTPGKSKFTRFAVDTTKKVLEYFEEYFDFKYPLQKVDLIAVPDFAAGAMENWGAITFRETALLYYPETTAITKKNYIAEVVAHELAHQWFGNLVTMKWWNDLWLNESFATFMAYKALDNLWKEWDVWTQYLGDTVFRGMHLDSLKSSHPIQVEVNNVDEIDELFDEIAYDKGGSILRMLENFLDKDTFRNGLREYIKSYKYKNAEGKDLWETLEKTSGKPVSEFMKSFLEQTGFPVITVSTREDKLNLSQERFSMLPLENNNQIWITPLIISNGDREERHILRSKSSEFDINSKKYLDLNYDYSGFYITDYSDTLLDKISENYESLNNKDRLGLVNDLSYLLFSTKIKLEKFTQYIEKNLLNENDFFVIELAQENLFKAYNLTNNNSLKPLLTQLSKHALELTGMEPQENDYTSTVILRNGSLLILAKFGDEEVLKFIEDKFSKYLKDSLSLHSNLRGITYLISVMINENNWDIALEKYKTLDIQEEKLKFLQSLGTTKNLEKVKKTLEICLSPEIRFSNIVYAISGVSNNNNAKEITLEWLFNNWNQLLDNGGGMAHNILRNVLKYIIPKFGIGHESEVKDFIEKNKNENLSKTFDQVLEELEVNSRFVSANK